MRLSVWRWAKVWLRASFLPEQNYLIILSVVVGVLTGFGSVGFIYALEYVSGFARGPVASMLSRFGPAQLVLLPALGGLLVGPLVNRFAREAKGHGVPEVMTALASHGGRIRKRIVTIKVIASSLTIGFGGTAGREGPMVQIGSAIGSTVGQWTKLTLNNLRTLVTYGAAGGIAATFNAPIAAAIFSMEVLIGRIHTDFLLVLLTSLSSCMIARHFLGNFPAFMSPVYDLVSPAELPLYFLMGILIGTAAVGYVKLLYRSEDLFGAWVFPDYLKPAVGGLIVGVILRYFPEIYGSGLPAVESALWVRFSWQLLLALFAAELLANCATLGSGGSGGGLRAEPVHGSDAGRRLRISGARVLSRLDRGVGCVRDGRDGSLLCGRRQGPDDLDSDPVRDDEQLPDHAAANGSHGRQCVRFTQTLSVHDLHAEAGTSRNRLSGPS